MQTISVKIQDSYIEQFMDFVNNSNSNIIIEKDKNLEIDPYFYERQKELHQIRDDIKNGKIEMVAHEEVWTNIKKHLSSFER